MANDPSIYDTREQLDFARAMAKSLLGEGHYIPDRGMATLPGTWMYGVPNIIRAISGAQYRDVAGDRESKLISNVSGKPNIPAQKYGRWAHQPPSNKADTKYIGGDPDATAALNEGKTDPSADVSMASGDDFIRKLIQIESGGNPNARTGSYRGLGQFGRAEEKRYGINDTNWNNPEIATKAIKQHMAWLYPQLEQKLGRAPTPGELYLAHQQGVAGGPALLANPDQPAWKVIRPYYDSEQMAKLAITGNIPNGHYLKKIPVDDVKAGDFTKLWTTRFDTAPDTQKFAGRMNLGGPKVEGENQPTNQPLGDIQLAQAGGPNRPVITTNPPVSPPIQAPGYGVPPANPVLTQDQLDATLRLAPAEQRAKIMEDYLKSKEGRTYKTPFGERQVTPPGEPGGQPIVTDMPSKTFPLNVGGMSVEMIPNPDGSMRMILPGGKDGGTYKDLGEVVDKLNKIAGQGSAVRETEESRGKHYRQVEDDIISRGTGAAVNLQMLKLAKAMSNDPTFYSGTGTERVLNISKLASYLTGTPWSGSTEAFSKIIAGANIAGLEAFKGYGQIRNPEIELLREASGNTNNSPQAIQAIIEMNMRASQRLMDISERMRKYRSEHGRLDTGFDDEMAKFYKEKPLFTDEEIKGYRSLFKTAKFKTEVLPNGAIRRQAQ